MGKSAVVDKPPSALVKLSQDLDQAEKEVSEAEDKLKRAKAIAEITEKKLVDQMITEGIRAFRSESGGYRTEAVCYPNVVDKEALAAFLRRRKSLAFLYTTQVHGGKLKSYVKELLESGKEIPPGIEPYTTTVIRRFQ